jgi:RecA/RadA recombinase
MTTKNRGGLAVVGKEAYYDLDAEESLLGAMLLSAEARIVGVENAAPAHFYKPAHGFIFEAIANLTVSGRGVDPVTVADELRRLGTLDGAGGPEFLIHLEVATPSTRNAIDYALIVAEKARARRLMTTSTNLTEALRTGDWAGAERLLAELHLVEPTTTALESEDIATLMESDEPPIEAELLHRTDHRALLVRSSVTLLHGEPSSGKSWLTVEAVRQVMTAGEMVAIIDYEGSSRTLAERLKDIRAHPDLVREHLKYLRPAGAAPERATSWLAAVERVVASWQPALVVIDGFAAALAKHGKDEDKAADCLWFMGILARPLADTGASVVLVDHVTKAKDARGRWGRGSGAKLGEADAGFSLEVVEPFARGHNGSAALRVAKDRWGAIGPEGSTVASVAFITDLNGRLQIELQPPPDAVEEWVGPTACMAAIVEVLMARDGEELHGAQLITALRAIGKPFRDAVVREAAERLALDPNQPVTARRGARRSRLYRFEPGGGRLGDDVDDEY